jgi:hypothetical protein
MDPGWVRIDNGRSATARPLLKTSFFRRNPKPQFPGDHVKAGKF